MCVNVCCICCHEACIGMRVIGIWCLSLHLSFITKLNVSCQNSLYESLSLVQISQGHYGCHKDIPDGFMDVKDDLWTSYGYQLQINSAKSLWKIK